MEKFILFISTTENVPGRNYEILGLVNGNNIESRNAISDFGQGLRNMVGGELKGYTDMMIKSHQKATERIVEQAEEMGADAILMVRYNTSTIVENSSEVHCYGTAVKFI